MSEDQSIDQSSGVSVSEPAASVPEPVVEPAAPPIPKVPKKGVYVLEDGDTPGRVSIKLYGRSHRAVELARLNMDSSWEEGDVINLP